MDNKITSQLTISNSDFVTLMVEEKKEMLNLEIKRLFNRQEEIIKPYKDKLEKKLDDFYDSDEVKAFIEVLYNFTKIYNPDVDFRIKYDSVYEQVDRMFRYHPNSIEKLKISPYCLEIKPVDEDDEEKMNYFSNGEEVEFPPHLEKEFKLNASDEDCEEYRNCSYKISNYQHELRNSDSMKNQLIAKMTKQVILNSPELMELRKTVLTLDK